MVLWAMRMLIGARNSDWCEGSRGRWHQVARHAPSGAKTHRQHCLRILIRNTQATFYPQTQTACGAPCLTYEGAETGSIRKFFNLAWQGKGAFHALWKGIPREPSSKDRLLFCLASNTPWCVFHMLIYRPRLLGRTRHVSPGCTASANFHHLDRPASRLEHTPDDICR